MSVSMVGEAGKVSLQGQEEDPPRLLGARGQQSSLVLEERVRVCKREEGCSGQMAGLYLHFCALQLPEHCI